MCYRGNYEKIKIVFNFDTTSMYNDGYKCV